MGVGSLSSTNAAKVTISGVLLSGDGVCRSAILMDQEGGVKVQMLLVMVDSQSTHTLRSSTEQRKGKSENGSKKWNWHSYS